MATHTQELPGSPLPSVSVILPVLNEELHLESAVLSILSQDYRGSFEVILAIGPSKDRTLEIAEKLSQSDSRVVIVESPTGRTAAGLNLALKKSSSPVVVRVDGHAQIPQNYISLVVEILNASGAVNVGGVMAAVGKSRFEKAVAGAMRSPFGVGASRFHTGGVAGVVDTVYLGAFRREALLAIGGFDQQQLGGLGRCRRGSHRGGCRCRRRCGRPAPSCRRRARCARPWRRRHAANRWSR